MVRANETSHHGHKELRFPAGYSPRGCALTQERHGGLQTDMPVRRASHGKTSACGSGSRCIESYGGQHGERVYACDEARAAVVAAIGTAATAAV